MPHQPADTPERNAPGAPADPGGAALRAAAASPPHSPPAREHTPPTRNLAVTVVHAEETFVVVNKPAGMLSVPGRGEDKQDCARSQVQALFPHATGPMTCHRLDMDTSGLLVLALNPETHRKLSGQFEDRKVRKWYEALVLGPLTDAFAETPEGKPLRVNLSQCVDWPNRPLQKIDWVNGKLARTDCILHEHIPWTTPAGDPIQAARVEMRPITGRTHQLRLAAATPRRITGPAGVMVAGGLGAPILGDRLYGGSAYADRLCLHARRLGFWHPGGTGWVVFESGEQLHP